MWQVRSVLSDRKYVHCDMFSDRKYVHCGRYCSLLINGPAAQFNEQEELKLPQAGEALIDCLSGLMGSYPSLSQNCLVQQKDCWNIPLVELRRYKCSFTIFCAKIFGFFENVTRENRKWYGIFANIISLQLKLLFRPQIAFPFGNSESPQHLWICSNVVLKYRHCFSEQ